jgi:hypothetical protein
MLEAMSTRLVLALVFFSGCKTFKVLAGTPVLLRTGSSPEMPYLSLDTWRVTIDEAVLRR